MIGFDQYRELASGKTVMFIKRCKNCGWFFEVKGNRKVFCTKECEDKRK